MKTLTTFTKPTLLATGIALGLGTSSALAADFRSTYTFADTATPTVNTVIVNFSTDVTSGTIDETNLTDWSIELLNGTTSVYLDNVIAGGAVQPIGGVSRVLSGISFDFDLDTLEYISFTDNDLPPVQTAATGVTYNIFNDETFVEFVRYVDGVDVVANFITEFNLTTEDVTPAATTPEPGTLLGLLVVGSMGALARKRK